MSLLVYSGWAWMPSICNGVEKNDECARQPSDKLRDLGAGRQRHVGDGHLRDADFPAGARPCRRRAADDDKCWRFIEELN
jgi:hypothetical protein